MGELHKYPRIYNYWRDLFKPSFRLIAPETAVYGDFGALSKHLGRIDYVAKYAGFTYLIEEDMSYGDKWHWSKILAYRAAYILDNPTVKPGMVKCMIFIPDAGYNPKLRNICAFLDLEYVCFDTSNAAPKVTKCSLNKIVK